jgi:hypothetical protein
MLLAGLSWFFWPFVSGPGQMQDFPKQGSVNAAGHD